MRHRICHITGQVTQPQLSRIQHYSARSIVIMFRGYIIRVSSSATLILLAATFNVGLGQDLKPVDPIIIDPVLWPCPQGQQCCSNGVCCDLSAVCGCGGCVKPISIPPWPTTPACRTCDPMTLTITADDQLADVFIDGVSVLSPKPFNGWQPPAKAIPIPAASTVIAIKANDLYQVYASILASVNNDYLWTDASWKCSATYSAYWYMPTFDDTLWQQAVVGDSNPSSTYGTIPGISTNAKWIWTANNGHAPSTFIDTPVYCRGYFPKNSCNKNYGSCGNLCEAQNKTCCNCRMLNDGPTKVCSCCPRGYTCCGPSKAQQKYGCCPTGSTCSPDKTSCLIPSCEQEPVYGKCFQILIPDVHIVLPIK